MWQPLPVMLVTESHEHRLGGCGIPHMASPGVLALRATTKDFSNDFDLPNESAYCETCASVGMVVLNQRMNLLTGDSKFIDVWSVVCTMGARDGLSLSGDHFFMATPLASNGRHFGGNGLVRLACPANIARLVASLGDYVMEHLMPVSGSTSL